MRVDFAVSGDGWRGKIDIPTQGVASLPLVPIEVTGEQVRFTLQGVPGGPTFVGKLAGGELRGAFTQSGALFAFTLHRGSDPATALRRPQEPRPPFPYRVDELRVASGDAVLACSLVRPDGAGPFPAAVLVTGSGAQDRDEALFGHRPFRVLADHLARAGIASLRCDDRGVGGSTGAVTATTSDFADDAIALVARLRGQAGIAADRVGIIGHSEGGNVGPLAASRSPEVAFVVMLAGTGVPGGEILERQTDLLLRAAGLPPEKVAERLVRLRERLVLTRNDDHLDEATVQARMRDNLRREIVAQGGASPGEATLDAAVKELLSPWMRFFLAYDPRPTLARVRVPVLALNGERDLQVDPEQNLPEVARALAAGGNRDVTSERLPGLNHLFQTAKTGALGEYGTIEETFSPVALDRVTSWILARFGSPLPSSGPSSPP